MKLEYKSLRSKIARKIFIVFLLAAFIPLVIVSFISYFHISDQLLSETRRNIFRESKAMGAVVLDRLIATRTGLNILKDTVEKGNEPDPILNDDWVDELFRSIYVIDQEGQISILKGDYEPLKALPVDKYAIIEEGGTVLQLDYSGLETSSLFLRSNILFDERPAQIVAELNRDYVWNFSIYPPQLACVLTPTRLPIACSELVIGKDKLLATLERNQKDREMFFFAGPSEEYVGMTWSLFLDAEFNSEDLVVMVAMPRETIFTILEEYKSVFPQSLLLTGVFVALLSLVHIRRYMQPVEELMKGTKRIARGIYNQPVKVDSDDELEELSDSFNNMANRIDQHIAIIRLMAEMDSLILSTTDADYIIETLIVHLNRILKSDHVAIVRLNDDDEDTGAVLNINEDKDYENIRKIDIVVSNNELDELNKEHSLFELEKDAQRSYTTYARELGDRYFYPLPVYINKRIAGIICFSNVTEINITEKERNLLYEIGDHIAVVLSNSAWEEKLEKQINYDPLTDLPNRIRFRDMIHEAITNANMHESHFAVLLINLDRFRIINDSLGHTVGDQILQGVADILKGLSDENISLAKLGSDEFVMLIEGIEHDYEAYTHSARTAMKIMEVLKVPFNIAGRELFITGCVGIAIYPQDGDDMDRLLKSAKMAIHKAREVGPGNFDFHDESKDEDTLASLDISNQLRKALEHEELKLFYQPKVDTRTGKIHSAEALLRWEHPEKGLIGPGEFIQIAEESGLIVPMGFYAVSEACRQCREWLDHGLDIKIAVNLSAEQFQQPDLINKIEKAIKKHEIPAKNLELEITERTTFEDEGRTIDILNKLNETGLKLSIDDFGTGYSSMSYLMRLPVHSLKIDQSFVRGLPDDKDSVSIVRAIVAMAHGLELNIVAEGIEDEDQYNFLKSLGCGEIQGYYFSKPVAGKDFSEFVQRFNASYSSAIV